MFYLHANVGILGLLHKRMLGKTHPIFQSLLPFHADVFGNLRQGEHNRQLYGHILDVHFQHALHSRSIFGMVYVYNRLPQEAVDLDQITMFQKYLTLMARQQCKEGNPNWMHAFSSRCR